MSEWSEWGEWGEWGEWDTLHSGVNKLRTPSGWLPSSFWHALGHHQLVMQVN